jgi:hypothetical protein
MCATCSCHLWKDTKDSNKLQFYLSFFKCCEIWSAASKVEHRPRVAENRALKRICGGPKKEKVTGENCIMRSFIVCTIHQIFLGW